MNQLALEALQQGSSTGKRPKKHKKKKDRTSSLGSVTAMEVDEAAGFATSSDGDQHVPATHLRRVSGSQFAVVRPASAPAEGMQQEPVSALGSPHPFPPPTTSEIDLLASPGSTLGLDVLFNQEEAEALLTDDDAPDDDAPDGDAPLADNPVVPPPAGVDPAPRAEDQPQAGPGEHSPEQPPADPQ
jgi:hypothetical protein